MTMTEPALPTLPGWLLACKAEPASLRRRPAADIPLEDWDLLFRAALEHLGRVAPESAHAQLQSPGAVLRECIDALDQLRRTVPTASEG